jgi:electron transport complex protein RnfG
MTEPTGSGKAANTPSMWRGGIILGVLAAVCTALVANTHRYTEPLIKANDLAYLERSLKPVLGGITYEHELTKSLLDLPIPHGLPGTEAAQIYRIYADGAPAAALFIVSARDGFAGPIKLLIGVRIDGTITSVRVLQHKETPGLGDKIESEKSDWLLQFNETSLSAPDRASWLIKRDGGELDQLTGASVTPRAIIKAIKETLLYFESNSSSIFSVRASDQDDQS